MKIKTLIIVNPVSGIGKQRRIETLLKDNLNQDLFDYKVVYTERIHHGTELARDAADRGYGCVVAVGGDGSVNDVVQGLKDTDVCMGIVPCGSGNGLACSLRIPLQPWLAIRALNHRYEQVIDTIVVNDKYACVNAAGVGFDAHISRLMQTAKTRGLPAYTNFVLRAYANYHSSDYKLKLNGREYLRNAWIISVQNSDRIGFNLTVSPKAKIDDGIMDISIIDKVPIDHVPISLQLSMINHLDLSQHVEIFRTKELVIEGNRDKWVDIDGESISIGDTVRFVNHPKSLHVFARDMKQLLIVRT